MTTDIRPGSRFHAETPGAVVACLGVDPDKGLAGDRAARKLAQSGRNSLPAPKPRSAIRAFLDQLANPLVLTLLVAAAVAMAVAVGSKPSGSLLSRFGDAIAIVCIVLLNATLGVLQEARAEAALKALQKLTAPLARVRRDGQTQIVPGEQVVVGDLLELEPGDAVAADARVLESVDLSVDEAALTGESVPVHKNALAEVAVDAPVADRRTMVYSATVVVRGKARALVVATGARTELGRIGAMLGAISPEPTPLEQRLRSFGRAVLVICLALSSVLLGYGLLASSRPLGDLLLEAVSLAVAAIPEGLPAITTITLALGMHRMARRGALVRRLVAVEALGTATVIASDKTGTLTQNAMTVREIWTKGGAIKLGSSPSPLPESEIVGQLLATITICNDAKATVGQSGELQLVGDPTETALLAVAADAGIFRDRLLLDQLVVRELPFDGDRKRMTVVTRGPTGTLTAHVKGGVEAVLPRCVSVATATGIRPLDEAAREGVHREAQRMGAAALRVLAVCRRDLGSHDTDVDPEQRLTLLGLVGMMDPPREKVPGAIASCKEAGIRVVMITGDHPVTAMAIAREIGLWEEGDQVMRGDELAALGDEELAARVMRVRVFARTTATDKHRIMRALKTRGQIVAMTGDGVNDAPALRESHIGVAMGKSGTDVARQAADLVLADDDFTTIVAAVAEGRAIYRNIQKFIFFLLSSNMGLVVAVFAISLIGRWPPLSPLMILWINLVTNGLPALALGVDPSHDDSMKEPPRREGQRLLGGLDYLGVLFVGAVIGLGAVALYALAEATGAPLERARTQAFTLLALAPLFHAWSCRSPIRSLFSARPLLSPALLLAVLASIAIHLAALWIPALRPLFATHPPSAREWLLVLALSAAVVPAVELAKLGRRIVRRLRPPNGRASTAAAAPAFSRSACRLDSRA